MADRSKYFGFTTNYNLKWNLNGYMWDFKFSRRWRYNLLFHGLLRRVILRLDTMLSVFLQISKEMFVCWFTSQWWL